MAHVIYLRGKRHYEELRDKRGFGYSDRIEEVAEKISKEWAKFGCFDDKHNMLSNCFQDPVSGCNSIVEITAGGQGLVSSLQFSFTKREVLEKTLQNLDLPIEDISK